MTKPKTTHLITTIKLPRNQARDLATAVRKICTEAAAVKLFIYTRGIAVEPVRTRKRRPAPRLRLV